MQKVSSIVLDLSKFLLTYTIIKIIRRTSLKEGFLIGSIIIVIIRILLFSFTIIHIIWSVINLFKRIVVLHDNFIIIFMGVLGLYLIFSFLFLIKFL